ncbi:DUF211 domain-containing protein [Candidatus Pacearchaeota archaeon]|nr:DUF211 domain-containing protein [Candidatus Pacearchaeota archaeon]
MPVNIRRLVVDSLKPRESSILDLSRTLCEVVGVEEVDINVTEVDAKTETVKVIIRGTNVDYDGIRKSLEEHGSSVRSIDEINVRKTKTKTKSK